MEEAQDLTVDIAQMSPLSLNFWMTKFVGEIGNCSVLIYHPLQALLFRISHMKLKQVLSLTSGVHSVVTKLMLLLMLF